MEEERWKNGLERESPWLSGGVEMRARGKVVPKTENRGRLVEPHSFIHVYKDGSQMALPRDGAADAYVGSITGESENSNLLR